MRRVPDRTSESAPRPPVSAWQIAAAVLIALLLLIAREALIGSGRVYGDTPVRALTVVAAALFIVASVAIIGTRNFTGLAATVGAATAVFAAFDLYAPAAPEATALPACPGAQIRNVKMLATTHPNGANVRTGPSRTYGMIRRFQPHCSVGFVGYCLGEPEVDLFQLSNGFEVRDMRWLELPHHRGFIHGGAVATQGVDETLPHRRCRGELPGPERPTLRWTQPVRNVVLLTATAENAPTVGWAAYTMIDGNVVLTRIAMDSEAKDGFSFAWHPAYQRTNEGVGRGNVTVVAAACLAGEVASELSDAVDLQLGPHVVAIGGPPTFDRLDHDLQQRIRRKACLYPDAPPEAGKKA